MLDDRGRVDNDATARYVELAQWRKRRSGARSGPSGMMDGQVAAIRETVWTPAT